MGTSSVSEYAHMWIKIMTVGQKINLDCALFGFFYYRIPKEQFR